MEGVWCNTIGCEEEVPEARAQTGKRDCPKCGERKARAEALAKSKQVVQMHKSNAVFIGNDTEKSKKFVLDIARMRTG